MNEHKSNSFKKDDVEVGGGGGGPPIVIALGGTPVLTGTPTWHRITINFSDFTAVATTEEIVGFVLPAGGYIHGRTAFKHSTSWAGGSISAANINLLSNKSGTIYGSSGLDVFQAPGGTVFRLGNPTDAEDFGATTNINARLITTGDNVNAATQGQADIWILLSGLLP